MATETFVIKIQEVGAAQAAAGVNAIGTAAKKTGAAVQHTADIMGFFRKALVAFASLRIAGHMMDFADSTILIDNRLRVATKSAEEFARAQKFIFQVSRDTRSEVQANAVVYSRLLQATSELKFSTEEMEQVMKTLTQSIAIGGATSQEARNAMIQFSQALASGALRGDELRSVAEQLPVLANAIGKEFGVAKGQVIAFAKANPGILETNKVLRGVLNAAAEIDRQFAETTPTMASGITVISNSFKLLLTEVQHGTGLFSGFAQLLIFVGDHLKAFIAILGVLAAAWATNAIIAWTSALAATYGPIVRVIALTMSLVGAQEALNIAVMANPYVAAAVALLAVGAALIYLYNTVPAVKEVFDRLMESIKSVGTAIYNFLTPVIPVLTAAWQVLTATFGAWLEVVGTVVGAFMSIYKAIYDVLDSLGVTTFAWESFKVVLTGVAVLMLTMFLGAINAVAFGLSLLSQALAGLGIISDEQNKKVQAATTKLQEYSGAVMNLSLGVPGASEKIAELNKKYGETPETASKATEGVKQFNDGMDDMGKVTGQPISLLNQLDGALKTVAPAAERTGDSLTKTSDATVTLEQMSGAATETMKKLNPELFKGEESGAAAADGFRTAAGGADSLTQSINKLAEAYRKLNAAKGAAGSATITGDMNGQRAAGGPVRRGGTYLVGEEGPEIFTPGVSGYVTSNDKSLAAMSAPANDNTPSGSSGISSATKAMVFASNSLVDSVDIMTKSFKTWQKVDYRDYKDVQKVKYEAPTTSNQVFRDPLNGYHNLSTIGNNGSALGTARADGSAPLPGDADYIKNLGYQRVGKMTSVKVDKNDPTYMLRALSMLYRKDERGAAYQAEADRILQTMKDIRDNTASFKQFQLDNQAAMAAGGPAIDFQTLLPMLGLGGKSMGEHDPYGLLNYQPPARPATGHGELSNSESSNPKNEKDIKVQVNIATPNAQSFRQNQAQVEAQVAGMVKRALKRSGGA